MEAGTDVTTSKDDRKIVDVLKQRLAVVCNNSYVVNINHSSIPKQQAGVDEMQSPSST